MGRGSLTDPDLPNKAKGRKNMGILKCVSGVYKDVKCHYFFNQEVTCLVNPTGRT